MFLFYVDVTDDPNAGGRVKTEERIESRPTRWLLDIAVIIALFFFFSFSSKAVKGKVISLSSPSSLLVSELVQRELQRIFL